MAAQGMDYACLPSLYLSRPRLMPMEKTGTEAVASIMVAMTRSGLRAGQQPTELDEISVLGQLLLQQAACQKLQQHLQLTLEFWPPAAASISHVQQHELVIRCSDGSAASRVRFMQNDILQAVQHYANASSVVGVRKLFQPVTRIRATVAAHKQFLNR